MTATVDGIATVSLVGRLPGESFELHSDAIRLAAKRLDAQTLTGTSLSAGGASRFVLPSAVLALIAEQGGGSTAAAEIDVEIVEFAANPYAHTASGRFAVGVASELALRLVNSSSSSSSSSSTLSIAGLDASDPIRLSIPLAAPLDDEDDSPFVGSGCGTNRSACDAELEALNASFTRKLLACRAVEGQVLSIFSQHAVADCVALSNASQRALEAKEAECAAIEAPPCSGRGTCRADGSCACEGAYYGANCGRVLQCSWWNGSGFESSGCSAVGVAAAGDSSSGAATLACECSHLTLFEALYEVNWADVEVYNTVALPQASLPFSRWGELWESLGRLHPVAYVLMASVLLVLTLLLLWARREDGKTQYVAYMPSWYKFLRRVERTARRSDRCSMRASAWPLLLLLWFLVSLAHRLANRR